MARRGVWSRERRQRRVPPPRLGALRPFGASSPEPLPPSRGALRPQGAGVSAAGKRSSAPEEPGLGLRAVGGVSPRKPRASSPVAAQVGKRRGHVSAESNLERMNFKEKKKEEKKHKKANHLPTPLPPSPHRV